MGRGVAALCVLLLLGFVLLRTGPSNASASHHRKLGGHLEESNGVKILDTKVITDTIITDDAGGGGDDDDDEDIAGIDIQNTVSADTDGQDKSTESAVIKPQANEQQLPPPQGLYALTALDIDGNNVSMAEFAGKTLLIVNVASACGYTDQNYKGLQELYSKYGSYGLEILAFPSNQFGGQEPGDEATIKQFAVENYGVTFRLMSKVDVNGPNAHPIYKYIKKHLPVEQGGGGGVGAGNDLVWNFNKFLVDKHGRPSAFYYQNYDGPRLESDVYTFLSAP